MPLTFDDIKKIRDACLAHAGDLLAAARHVAPASPHVAYHLATLCLEELGKSQILLLEATPGHPEEVARSFEKMRDDHVKKLFWALWGPTFTHGRLSTDQMRDIQGFANAVHERRLAALYVDWRGGVLSIPSAAVSTEHAQVLIELAEARLGLEKAEELREPTVEGREMAKWFMQVAKQEEYAPLIFGRRSIDKLNEVRDARAWITWLQQEFEQNERASRESLERELARAEPSETERFEPKWRLRFRFFTPSHSLRQSVLARFNRVSEHLKFHQARTDELVVEYVLPKGLHIGWLWDAGFASGQHILLALNIGSCGFFWWQPSRYAATYFERIDDLEVNQQVRVERRPKLQINWGRNVLDSGVLNRLALCLRFVPLPKRGRDEANPYQHYLDGLAFLGKTDVHLQLEANAFESFFGAFRLAAKKYGDWDGTSDFEAAALQIIDRIAPGGESWRAYVRLGCEMTARGATPRAIDLGDVGGMKVWTDAYLIKTFQRLAGEERRAADEGEGRPG